MRLNRISKVQVFGRKSAERLEVGREVLAWPFQCDGRLVFISLHPLFCPTSSQTQFRRRTQHLHSLWRRWCQDAQGCGSIGIDRRVFRQGRSRSQAAADRRCCQGPAHGKAFLCADRTRLWHSLSASIPIFRMAVIAQLKNLCSLLVNAVFW